MPLTSKGKKIMSAMKEQYGKNAERVFYASKNKGTIKGVDVKKAFKGAEIDARTKGKAISPGTSAKGTGRSDNPYSGGDKKQAYKDVPFKKPLGFFGSTLAGAIIPFSGSAVNFLAKKQYEGRQKFARKKGLYRDFYKTENKPLQPNSPIGKTYLKEAGFGKSKNLPTDNNRESRETVSKVIKPKKKLPILPKQNFFNFQAYGSGGISSGPPPKSGPNPHVPPIKMKSGKMNNMTCPHRPDGIRGMGAAIKGSKFIGVK
tara:strand:+ start:111 stop:887 length:777 start_codon:yes stop_codon:yes gene_type:complete